LVLFTNADKLNVWAWRPLNTPLDPALTIYPSISYAFRNRPSLHGGTRAEYAIVILALIAPWSLHVRNAEELRRELVVRNFFGSIDLTSLQACPSYEDQSSAGASEEPVRDRLR
jgi:hypothetical protein